MKTSAALRAPELPLSERDQFLADVIDGLSASRKTLDPKYFYDEAGSRLFEQITELPEYYITRTETRLMREIAGDIGEHCGESQAVVEFGSGSGERSDILLSALPNVSSYVPIDVSEELLASTAGVVERAYPRIKVLPLVADFTEEMQLPAGTPARRLGYFPGSTIGNFLPESAEQFLAAARELLEAPTQLLIGVDLAKATETLEDAYNDADGVTAKFNRNMLRRINTELDADFRLENFEHQSFFDRNLSRIEMHLVSLADQTVSIGRYYQFNFRAGETIHTENSHKFTIDGFRKLAQGAGWQCATHWVDEDRLFSIHLLTTD